MALGAAYYSELVTTTLESIEKDKLVDQVLVRQPTLDLLKGEASSDSGRSLVLPLIGAEDGGTTFTDASGTFSTAVSGDIAGASEFDWASPLVSKVRLKFVDIQKNLGSKTQVFNLLKTHLEAAQRQHARVLASSLWASVSDFSAGEPVPFSLAVNSAAGDQDPSAETGGTIGAVPVQTYGGIDSAVNTFWVSPVTTSSAAAQTILQAFRGFERDLEDATSAMSKVSHIIAGRDVYEEYEDALDDKVRYVVDGGASKDAQTRFKDIYHGDVVVRYDPQAPADEALFLDIDSWRFRYLNDQFMKVQDTQQIQGTLDFVTPIASVISIGTNERRANGRLIRTA